MPAFFLRSTAPFPDPRTGDPGGLLAVGGDLAPGRLLEAYAAGIFPWFNEGDPVMWWCPPERAVWLPGDFQPGGRLRRALRAKGFQIRVDSAFESVIQACAQVRRHGEPGTWIGPEMIQAYTELHRLGFAHSFEAWSGSRLAGGLYGLSLGAAFFGESMFSREREASKAAFAALSETVFAWGFHFIDGQLVNPHLSRLGARTLTRDAFLGHLQEALREPTRRGSWGLPT
ncbi:MAG: leucyl/phenylalanyl-tRNA--protein transferase [Acidobacteria bacterium]|nr:leucyl/phenylalanyl-tRNA--protein transferase [Acidobacteriota bacterium]